MGGELAEPQELVGEKTKSQHGNQEASTHGRLQKLSPQHGDRRGQAEDEDRGRQAIAQLPAGRELTPRQGGVGTQQIVNP